MVSALGGIGGGLVGEVEALCFGAAAVVDGFDVVVGPDAGALLVDSLFEPEPQPARARATTRRNAIGRSMARVVTGATARGLASRRFSRAEVACPRSRSQSRSGSRS